MTIEEYYNKREKLQFEEAKEMALIYKERFGKEPPKEVFNEYFMLFCNEEVAKKTTAFYSQMKTNDNYDDCVA